MEDTLLDVEAVARLLEVKPETVRSYHKKGRMPQADQYFGRSPVWKANTIETWRSKRKPRPISVAALPDAELVGAD